jgi:hypothetical protein
MAYRFSDVDCLERSTFWRSRRSKIRVPLERLLGYKYSLRGTCDKCVEFWGLIQSSGRDLTLSLLFTTCSDRLRGKPSPSLILPSTF